MQNCPLQCITMVVNWNPQWCNKVMLDRQGLYRNRLHNGDDRLHPSTLFNPNETKTASNVVATITPTKNKCNVQYLVIHIFTIHKSIHEQRDSKKYWGYQMKRAHARARYECKSCIPTWVKLSKGRRLAVSVVAYPPPNPYPTHPNQPLARQAHAPTLLSFMVFICQSLHSSSAVIDTGQIRKVPKKCPK